MTENGLYGLTAAQQASTTSGTGASRGPSPPGGATGFQPSSSQSVVPTASITAPIANLGIDDDDDDDAADDRDDAAAAPQAPPYRGGDETATLAEYPYSIYNHGTWTADEDKTLIQARSRGQNWAELQRTHFPTKTANACRKRYERLVERRGIYDYSGRRLEMVANEYMNMRKEIWSGLADRLGMKWDAVEALCMGVGLRSIQSNARSYTNRARREVRMSKKTRESQAEAVSLDPVGLPSLAALPPPPPPPPPPPAPAPTQGPASSGTGRSHAHPIVPMPPPTRPPLPTLTTRLPPISLTPQEAEIFGGYLNSHPDSLGGISRRAGVASHGVPLGRGPDWPHANIRGRI
ncbi:uncharacterized protein B0T15DRAFT_404576 [Chaetomium strumarium]|uniref:Myb-like domain-containing protein n=1 Tax=Chaetomium strumarium TaxID=1170767 RepID=A0AAJ0LYS6_9PEZI|nr:hypothetical protein B0T15DRAFT_404576 [Chaetomium strumarium]